MLNILSVNDMRLSDCRCIESGVKQEELINRAAKALFENGKYEEPVLIVVGKGNNGEDGVVLSKILTSNNIENKIYKVFEDKEEIDFSKYNTIVDGIFGTGFKGDINEDIEKIINKINDSNAYVISIDINSGLYGDNGLGKICVKSDLTISIGNYQPGHFLNDAKDVMKQKKNVDIGIKAISEDIKLLEFNDIKDYFKPRLNNTHKGTYGYMSLIGGSSKYSGAIRLASMANVACRNGVGVCSIACPKSIAYVIRPEILEATLNPLSDNDGDLKFEESEFENIVKRSDTIVFGMGIGDSEETKKAIIYLLENYNGTLIIDADGLNALSRVDEGIIDNSKAKLILTPHPKEFSKLSKKEIKEILNDPISNAKEYALKHKLIVLLKGTSTVISDGIITYISDTGVPGMSKGGSGDVLAGIVGAICASQKEDLLLSTSISAYINGLAGQLAQNKESDISVLPSDTINSIKDVFRLIKE